MKGLAALWAGIRCRLCWKVTLGVFFSILTIEAAILIPSVINYERDRLESIEQTGREVVTAFLAGSAGMPSTATLARMIERTSIRGLVITHSTGQRIQVGEAPSAAATDGDSLRSRRRNGSPDRMWLAWSPGQIAEGYSIRAGLSTTDIDAELRAFVLRIGGLVLLIALFVTGVTMPLLQYLVLGPILDLRRRMRAAGDNPQDPLAYTVETARRDEIGDTGRAFDRMLRLVNDNLQKIADREQRYRQLNARLDQRVAERTEELRQANATLEYRASHDELTDLYNRTPFSEHLASALALGTGSGAAVFFIGIDNLNSINGLHGYQTGDWLLRTVARRLAAHIDHNTLVAHFGGDIFALLLSEPGQWDEDALHAFATRLRDKLERPTPAVEHALEADVSIGFSVGQPNRVSAETLMRQADLALLAARRGDSSRIARFEPALETAMDTRLRLVAGLRRALENGEFSLVYQTQHTTDGQLTGAEALLRWHSPTEGDVRPADFIPIAEETGLIREIGDHVLHLAIRQVAEWRRQGHDVQVGINVSPLQLHDDHLVTTLEDLLARYHVPPELIELEITESALIEVHERRADTLERLAATAVHLSIDDFGTGYSSLAYLGRLPVNRLKIDRTFIKDLPHETRSTEICRSIIELARQFHLDVLAEGVEARSQVDWLAANGCRRFQGFLFARPAPPSVVANGLAAPIDPAAQQR